MTQLAARKIAQQSKNGDLSGESRRRENEESVLGEARARCWPTARRRRLEMMLQTKSLNV
jgi:hypothetical protein